MILSLLIVLLVILLPIVVFYRWSIGLPGPFGLPILGYLPFIDKEAPHVSLSNLVNTYGKIFSVQFGSVNVIVLSDFSLIKKAFFRVETSGRAPLFLTHGIMEGYGLICSQGHQWKISRKFVKQLLRLTSKTLEEDLSNLLSEFFVTLRHKKYSYGEFNSFLSHSIGNLMNRIIFGTTYSETDELWRELQRLRDFGIQEMSVSSLLNFLPWIRFFNSRYKATLTIIKEGQRKTHSEYKRLTEKVQREMIEDNITWEYLKRRQRFGNEYFSLKQLYYLQGDLFGAGTDTSLTTIKWLLLYLCLYPSSALRVRKEIQALNRKNIQMSDISLCHFTQAFIHEVQRLSPVLPLGVPHGVTSSISIEGWTLPQNSMILPLHWYLNRDAKLWKEPQAFSPERFLNEQGFFEKPEFFIPFQIGLRHCLGDNLGKTIIFLFLSKFVLEYSIRFRSDYQNYDIHQKHLHGFTSSPTPFEFILKKI